VAVILGGYCNTVFAQPTWYKNVGLVKINMRSQEVKSILGTPHTIRGSAWYYQSSSGNSNNNGNNEVVNYLAKGAIKKGFEIFAGQAMAYGKLWRLNSAIAPSIPSVADNASSLLTNGNNGASSYWVNVYFDNDLVSNVKYSGGGTENTSRYTRSDTTGNTNVVMHQRKNVSAELAKVQKNAPVYSKILNNNSVTHKSAGNAPYFVKNGIGHKPDCKIIKEVEKWKMDKFSTLEKMLLAGFSACAECCDNDEVVKLVRRNTTIINKTSTTNKFFVVGNKAHFSKDCSDIHNPYTVVNENELPKTVELCFCKTEEFW